MKSKYKCAVCGLEFEAMHFREVRFATGRTVEHCGEPAFWKGNIQ